MFWGQKSDWEAQKIYLPSALQKTFEEMLSHDLTSLTLGKHPLKSIADAFFIVQEWSTKLVHDAPIEAHKRFIDIQYLVKGAERIGVALPDGSLSPIEDRLEKDDIAFFRTPKNESFITLSPGQFVVFYPDELNRPCCCIDVPAVIRKTVIKVPVAAIVA